MAPTPTPSCPGLSGASTPSIHPAAGSSALRTRILCAIDKAEEEGLSPDAATTAVMAVLEGADPAFAARLRALGLEPPLAVSDQDAATLVDANGSTVCTVDLNRERDDDTAWGIARLLMETLNTLAGHGFTNPSRPDPEAASDA